MITFRSYLILEGNGGDGEMEGAKYLSFNFGSPPIVRDLEGRGEERF